MENQSSPELMSQAATNQGIAHSLFFYQYFSIQKNGDTKRLLYKDQVVQHYPDVVLFRGYHYPLMKLLKQKGALVINDPESARLAKDKWLSHQLLAEHQIPQPQTVLVSGSTTYPSLCQTLGTPFVLKDRTGQKGHNVFLIENQSQYEQALSNNVEFLAQTFVKNSWGTDVRVFVVGDKTFGMRRTNTSGGFKTNLAEGIVSEPIDLTPKQQKLAKHIASIFNLQIGSVDFLVDGDQWIFCEANSNAAFGSYLYFGIDMRPQFMEYISQHFSNYQNPHEQNKQLKKGDNGHLVQRGNHNIVFSAPHNVKQVRNLENKAADLGTGNLVLALHNQTHCSIILKTQCLGELGKTDDDANWQVEHPYKNDLEQLIKTQKATHLFDIHSLAKTRPEQINLGISGGQNVQNNFELVEKIKQEFEKQGFAVSVDQPYSAPLPTIAATMAQKTGVFSMQVEINSSIIDSNSDENQFDKIVECFKNIFNLISA